jgi:hypothetical protein
MNVLIVIAAALIVITAVIIIGVVVFLSRAYITPVARAQNAVEVINYLDAYRVAVREGVEHEQALASARSSVSLNKKQVKDVRRFVDLNRAALAATESRDDLAKRLMSTL